MNSVCIGGKADVNAIIDDQRRSGLSSDTPGHAAQLPRTAQKTPYLLLLRFVPQLDQRRACRNQLFRIPNNGPNGIGLRREAGEVDDGVERG